MMVSKLAVPGAVARNIHWYLRYLGMLLLQTFDVTTNRGPLALLVSQLKTKSLSATPFIILHFSYSAKPSIPASILQQWLGAGSTYLDHAYPLTGLVITNTSSRFQL